MFTWSRLTDSRCSSSPVTAPCREKTQAQVRKKLHSINTYHLSRTTMNDLRIQEEIKKRPHPSFKVYTSCSPQGLANIRAIATDPVRGLITDMAKPPKTLVPAPLVQKDAPIGYSYQQINCLDGIIRCLFVSVCMCVCVCMHSLKPFTLAFTLFFFTLIQQCALSTQVPGQL